LEESSLLHAKEPQEQGQSKTGESKADANKKTPMAIHVTGLGVLCLILGLGILLVFLLFVGFDKVLGAVESVNPWQYLLAFLSVSLGLYFYVLTWQALLRSIGQPPGLRVTAPIVLTSIFINFIIPTASTGGEAVRAYLLSKKSNIDTGRSVASVLAHRIITLLPFSLCATVGLIVLLISNSVAVPALWTIMVFATAASSFVALMLLSYFSKDVQALKKAAAWIIELAARLLRSQRIKKRADSWKRSLSSALDSFQTAVSLMGAKKSNLALSVLYAFLSWFFDAMVAFFVFYALGYNVAIPVILVVYAVGMVIQMFPLGIPGTIGVVEGVMYAMYASFGVPGEIAMSAALLIRIPMFWYLLGLGAVATRWST
jgi:uncharacterized protein (TIRG00374 family)